MGFLPQDIRKTSLMLLGEAENIENHQIIEILLFLFLKQLGFDPQNIQIILKKFSEKLKKTIENGLSDSYAGAIQVLDNKYVILNGFEEVFDLELLDFVKIERPPIFSFAVSIDGLIAEVKNLLV